MPLPRPEAPPQNPVLLHATLLAGTAVIALVFAYLQFFQTGPLDTSLPPLVGYGLAGISLACQMMAWMMLRPTIVPRDANQPVAEYWATHEHFSRALKLWVVVEGAAIVALVGWLLTGNLVALAAALAAILTQVINRPGALARR